MPDAFSDLDSLISPSYLHRIRGIESGFNDRNVTGSYKGRYQLHPREFARYGGTDIFDPVQNERVFIAKTRDEIKRFQAYFGRAPTEKEMYLMHQQGEGGARAHLSNPTAPAWVNMLNTGEGKARAARDGPEAAQRWAKAAIWGNIPDQYKKQFGSVDNVVSQDFTDMWGNRVAGTKYQGQPQVTQGPNPTPGLDPITGGATSTYPSGAPAVGGATASYGPFQVARQQTVRQAEPGLEGLESEKKKEEGIKFYSFVNPVNYQIGTREF